MPAKRALSGISVGPAEDCIMLSDHEHLTQNRMIRALPRHRAANAKFMRYRSGTHHMLTDDDDDEGDHDFDTTDTELGTALSDVEGEVQLELWSRDSTPHKHEGLDDQEGEIIDDALYTAASSPAPGAESDAWMGEGNGKAVDSREVSLGGWVDAKRRWNERDDEASDCDADDEDQVAEVVLKKRRKHTPTHLRLAKTNFGPTQSILEITSGMDGLGKGVSEITYTSIDEDDDVMVSAELFSAPPSPTPGPAMLQDSLCLARRSRDPPRLAFRKPRSAPQSSHNGPTPRRNDRVRRSRQRAPQRIVSSGSDSAMVTSDIEREMQEMESVDNVIARRDHLCDFPVREPRARDTSRLRRTSPTSLLPMRETQRHFRQLARAGRAQIKAEVGQALLAAASAAREARAARREGMRRFYENWQNPLGVVSDVVSTPTTFTFLPFDAAAAAMFIRRSHLRQTRNLERKSRERDHRRIAADRSISLTLAQPCRLPPPTITTPFAALLSLSETIPETPSMEAEVEEALFAPSSPVSSVVSDPPEYEPPTPPIRLALPPHLRPRPVPREPSNEVPAYGWLAEQSGGSYNRRRTPSPPPPFNAQTDCQTLIAPRFIDDDEEDEEEVDNGNVFSRSPSVDRSALAAVPHRAWRADVQAQIAAPASPRVVGAFPGTADLLPPVEILAPTPIRARSSFEAALDMEEGDEADEALGDGSDDVREEQDSRPVLSTLGRFLRFWR